MSEFSKRVAVVINGDASSLRALKNVEEGVSALRKRGYEVFAVNGTQPDGIGGDHYFPPTLEGLRQLQVRLGLETGTGTDLVIYTTGRGGNVGGAGSFCLEDGCYTEEVVSVLDGISYGRRTVIMDQNYSGNWSTIFSDSKTLFVAAEGENWQACNEGFASRFWAGNIPDTGGFGIVSWEERYNHAAVCPATRQFIQGARYLMDGGPSPEERLFERIMAAREKKCDWTRADELGKIASELAGAGLGEKAIPLFGELITVAEWIEDGRFRADALRDIASGLGLAGLEDKTIPLFDKLLAAAEELKCLGYHVRVFAGIAAGLARAGFSERAITVFETSVTEVSTMIGIAGGSCGSDEGSLDEWFCARAVEDIVSGLVRADLWKKAIPVFYKLVYVAKGICSRRPRESVMITIASGLEKAGLKKHKILVYFANAGLV